MLPTFIIIGGMKCGTTSLFRYLASDPEITAPSFKETDFFRTEEDFSRGIEWYESLFSDEKMNAFEASPNYTKRHLFPGVPGRMHSVLPAVKLIYVVRDPIDRLVSHWMHNFARREDSRPLLEALRDLQGNYVQTSKYWFQVQAFLELYPKEQLLIVEAERLRANQDSALREICEFLGISPRFEPKVLEERFHRSSAKKRQSWVESILTRQIQNRHLLKLVRTMALPMRREIQRPKLSSVEMTALREVLAPDVEKLRQFTGLKFSSWSL